MTDRPIDLDTTKSTEAHIKPTESREQRKARLATVYERGITGDRLHVDLPPDKYGQWVSNDVVSIHRLRALGFEIDTVYAPKRALHDKGDSASYVGDTLFMVCDMETKEIIDEIRRDRYERLNPKKGKQREEKAYIEAAGEINVPTSESRAREAKKEDLLSVLQTNN